MQGQGQGQQASLGAHEVMEVNEVLSQTISSINTCELYQPHIRDPQLRDVVERHRSFAIDEYNSLVSALNNRGSHRSSPRRTGNRSDFSPQYGLRNPSSERPASSARSIDDRDAASAVLGLHKCSASKRMQAAVECADPELRRMLVKGATNCSEQAYELFQLMNQKGWYQVPTLQPNTTQTMTSMYQPARDTRPNRNIEQHQPELFGASSVGVPHANMEPVNAGRAGIPQS